MAKYILNHTVNVCFIHNEDCTRETSLAPFKKVTLLIFAKVHLLLSELWIKLSFVEKVDKVDKLFIISNELTSDWQPMSLIWNRGEEEDDEQQAKSKHRILAKTWTIVMQKQTYVLRSRGKSSKKSPLEIILNKMVCRFFKAWLEPQVAGEGVRGEVCIWSMWLSSICCQKEIFFGCLRWPL